MAHTAFLTASVGSTLMEVNRFKIYPKIGKMSFAFLSQGARDNNGVVTGNPLKFRISESDDGVTWTAIGAAILVPSGAQIVRTIISHKSLLKLEGVGEAAGDGTIGNGAANAGGSAKVDITHNGIQYFGQIDTFGDATGKSGYAKVATAYTETNGTGSLSATAWPE